MQRSWRFGEGVIDVVIGPQQITSMLPEREQRLQAFREYHRVLAADGVLLCSFLEWKGRWFNPLLGALLMPIKLAKGDMRQLSCRYLPWLRIGGSIDVA